MSALAAPADSYAFAPQDQPVFPGSPFSPPLTSSRRAAYAVVAVLCGLASGFPNALVNTNVQSLAGEIGVYVLQATWLQAVYVAMNATTNLTLVKARIQFGIPAALNTVLIVYAAAAVLQFFAPTFASAVLIRAIDGVAGAGLVTMSIVYMLQVFPRERAPIGLLIGISVPQLGPALARVVPVELLSAGHWQGLHLIELAVALIPLSALLLIPLPPTERKPAFERLDFLSIGLLIPGFLLGATVLGLGRLLWWTDTPWLGWLVAGSAILLTAGMVIEHNRANPLLHTRWIGSRDLVRFAAVAVLVRLALAEQTYGSVGLLTSGGLTNDQLRILFALVALAMAAGIVTAVLTLNEQRIDYLVLAAALIIALGAWMDSHSSNLTRPEQLYLSQALLGFGTTLFIGPTLVYGILRVLRHGQEVFTTTIVLFSVTQNIGGLAGSALLGSLQTIFTRAHAGALSEHLVAADPQVADRLRGGVASLSQSLNREAGILAFNDVFSLVTALALATAGFIAGLILINTVRQRRLALAEIRS